MPVGDLSPDQARYVDIVADATGLDRAVVTSWVGAESGWGARKAGHNYLNIGPGRTYSSVEMAAAAASGLINASRYYVGIRAAIPAGGGAQVKAIGASPWGTSPTLLTSVYRQLAGSTAGAPTETVLGTIIPSVSATPQMKLIASVSSEQVTLIKSEAEKQGVDTNSPGFWQRQWDGFLGSFGLGIDPGKIPIVGGALADAADSLGKGAADAVKDAAGDVVGDVVGPIVSSVAPELLKVGLTMVFTVAALGLLAMSINKATGISPAKAFKDMSGFVGTAGMAAAL